MSGGRMPSCPASASEDFSSTPLKSSHGKHVHISQVMDNGVLSDDEDTFSLLSPIYHDSFDSSEEDPELSAGQQTSPGRSEHSLRINSPVRCEFTETPSEQMLSPAVEYAVSPSLSAWEVWLVNKAKEDRLKLEKKMEEECLLEEKKEQEEIERKKTKIITEEKIQEWLKMKRKKEREDQRLKQSKEEDELQRQQEKRKEIQQKAEQKYREWLQKKKQEELIEEQREKEKLNLKEEQERERRRRAEEKFKEWLAKTNEKSKAGPKTPRQPASAYDKSYPSPSFYNPVPWKPIHVPPPETAPNKTPGRKAQKQKKGQQSSSAALGFRNTASVARTLQKR
ncbi:coiled-coil domain-containing protein 34 [Aulostomus maculatus]